MMALLGTCHRGVEEITLGNNAFEWAFKLWAGFNASLVLVAFAMACFNLRPRGLLRQVLVEEIVNHLLD